MVERSTPEKALWCKLGIFYLLSAMQYPLPKFAIQYQKKGVFLLEKPDFIFRGQRSLFI